jgi:hypothetical protein
MKMERVDSSAVRRVGYEEPDHVLRLEYANGGVYDYLEVPEEEAERLMASDSIGGYVNRRIKPRYRHRLVRPPRR